MNTERDMGATAVHGANNNRRSRREWRREGRESTSTTTYQWSPATFSRGFAHGCCDGICIGDEHTVRTCSSKLNIRMSFALVCMSEATPNNGVLCFCRHDRCNVAAARDPAALPRFAYTATALLLLYYFRGRPSEV